MKRLLLIIAIVAMTIGVSAQKGKTFSLAVDTLQGAETVSFATMEFTNNQNFIVQALCAELGGTSDGTLAVYGSVDNTSFSFINGVGADVITASPKASITGADLNQITITDALIASWAISDSPYRYYKIVGVGTSGDTTKVTIKYMYW